MDFNSLYQDTIDKKFTDIELVLMDQSQSISICAHKNILAFSSKYFYSCLTFNDTNNKEKLVVHVEDAVIAYDIVLSFYNQKINFVLDKSQLINFPNWKYMSQEYMSKKNLNWAYDEEFNNFPDWKYLLETIKCRNFFCLDNNIKLLYDIKIPSEGFKLLLEIMDLFDYTNDVKLMRTIKINIPADYDLNNFSKEFVDEFLTIRNHKIISSGNKNIKIWDADSGQLINELKHGGSGHCWITEIAVSSDNLKIVSGTSNRSIKIWNINTGELLKKISDSGFVSGIAFSPDNLKLISSNVENYENIKIWDVNNGKKLHTFHNQRDVNNVGFFSDNLRFFSVDGKNINIWNTNKSEPLKTIKHHSTKNECKAILSPDNLKIAMVDDYQYISIWDTTTGKRLIRVKNNIDIDSIAFLSDNLKIVSCDQKNIKIWDIETGKLINSVKHNKKKHIKNIAIYPDDKKIVIGTDKIKILDINTGDIINTLPHEFCNTVIVCFSQ